MMIFAEATPGPLESVLDDAYNLATRTGAQIRFKFNHETVELFAGYKDEGAAALFYADDHTLTAIYGRKGPRHWEKRK